MGQNPECGMGQVCIHLGTLSSEGFPLSRGCLISAFHSLPRFGARDPFVLRCADPPDSPVKFLHDYSSLRPSKPTAWWRYPAGLPLRLIRGEPELKMLMADERPARPGDGAGLLLCEARSDADARCDPGNSSGWLVTTL